MADELLDIEASGSGGLDDAPGLDDDPGLITPQGPVEVLDDDAFDDGDDLDDDGDADDDWRDSLTDEQRSKLAQFGDVRDEALARAYLGLESRIGDFRGEIGQLRRLVEEREQREAAAAKPAESEPPTMGQLAAFADHLSAQVSTGDKEPEEAMAELFRAFAGVSEEREAALERRFAQLVAERTAPLEAQSEYDARAREINALKREYGDDIYAEFAPAAADLLNQWEATQPGFVRSGGAIRAAFNQAYTAASIRRARAAEAQILDGGGRRGGGRRGVSPARQVLDEMDAVAAPVRSGGGL